MTNFASLMFGTVALAAMIGVAQPAAARGGYVDPHPTGVSAATLQEYCRDYSYRQRHAGVCHRYYRADYRNDNTNARDRDRHHQPDDHENSTHDQRGW